MYSVFSCDVGVFVALNKSKYCTNISFIESIYLSIALFVVKENMHIFLGFKLNCFSIISGILDHLEQSNLCSSRWELVDNQDWDPIVSIKDKYWWLKQAN